MSFKLELKEVQIALKELEAFRLKYGSIHVPSAARLSLSTFGPEFYVERERGRRQRRHRQLIKQIRYLKERHYIELVKEGEERFYRLTKKGAYELRRIRFMQHMEEQRNKKWDRTWRIIIFDIPEHLRKYRDHLRTMLKGSGFQMWQFSVWVTKYNPEPALKELLRYLGLHKYYAIIEADCKRCSPRVTKVWKQMKRGKEDWE